MKSLNIAIIGASGGIGSAFVHALAQEKSNVIYAFSRSKAKFDYDNVNWSPIDICQESSVKDASHIVSSSANKLDLVVVTSGVLHDQDLSPEKSLRDLDLTKLEKYFRINTIGPMLVAKYFLPLLHANKRSIFAALSARVGSISDNRLGGWYGYRASKAALNMMLKNASIEITRNKKQAIVVGLHPGTVDSDLSRPFQKNVPAKQLFTAEYCAEKLLDVINTLTTDDSGKTFAWDGKAISY